MQLGTVGSYAITIGWLIAILVLFLCILGVIGILPFEPVTVFALIGGLAIARLL